LSVGEVHRLAEETKYALVCRSGGCGTDSVNSSRA
jgi:hypothetical protein